MTQTFVPFVPTTAKARAVAFTPVDAKSLAAQAAPQTLTGIPTSHPATGEACAKPTVTLERNGDIVSAIKIRCGCGEVVELTCVY